MEIIGTIKTATSSPKALPTKLLMKSKGQIQEGRPISNQSNNRNHRQNKRRPVVQEELPSLV